MHNDVPVGRDVSYLDQILLSPEGFIKPVKAQILHSLDLNDRQLWAVKNAVYQFITEEMITFLKAVIGKRAAIEICAGNGAIGRSLSIPATDDYQQQRPDIKAYYEFIIRQAPTSPPSDVTKMEACEAVRYYKPQVVVGGYVTQLYKEGDEGKIPSSVYGVDEEWILDNTECYVIFGNINSHNQKRIFERNHVELHFPWLVTRSLDQSDNRVWIWDDKIIRQ